jgi:hypothetical protein
MLQIVKQACIVEVSYAQTMPTRGIIGHRGKRAPSRQKALPVAHSHGRRIPVARAYRWT